MDKRSFLDELDALATGSLRSEDERRLRERCAADHELRALLESYLEIHALTEPADVAPPPCRLEFEELEGMLDPHRAWRVVLRRSLRAAAAVLVLVGSIAALSYVLPVRTGGGEAGWEPLALASIPLEADPIEIKADEVPALLADYRPVVSGEIRWIDSFETASALARVSSRPVLLFLHVKGCDICAAMQDETLSHPDVAAAMGSFVPARVDAWRSAEIRKLVFGDETRSVIFSEGWPWFGAVDPRGRRIHTFPGRRPPAEFRAELTEVARLAGPAPLDWDALNGLGARLEEARRAYAGGRPAEALADFRTLDVGDVPSPVRRDAERGIARIARDARNAVLSARSLARREGAEAAAGSLDRAVARFAGTPYAADLAAIRDRLRKRGRFPAIDGLR